jgi:hypothetical protein
VSQKAQEAQKEEIGFFSAFCAFLRRKSQVDLYFELAAMRSK